MTNWATLLLILYVSLGLSRMGAAKAARVAVVVTVIVVSVEMLRIQAGA